MFFIYNIENTNPVIGAVKGDCQTVSVYDRDLGNRRTVITSPEEVDEFVTARKHNVDSAAKQGLGIGAALIAIGAGAGAAINRKLEKSKAIKVNKLVDQINAEYKNKKALIKDKEKFSTFILDDIFKSATYKNFESKLRGLFSYNEEIFKQIDINALSKSSLREGAWIGGAIGLLIGIFVPGIKVENADKKITQAFIENNK